MKITYTAHAWADMKHNSLESLKEGRQRPLLGSEGPGTGCYFEREGYAYIGPASVTLTINPYDEIVASQVASLNVQLQAVRAEAQQKENQIRLQISNLQALSMG